MSGQNIGEVDEVPSLEEVLERLHNSRLMLQREPTIENAREVNNASRTGWIFIHGNVLLCGGVNPRLLNQYIQDSNYCLDALLDAGKTREEIEEVKKYEHRILERLRLATELKTRGVDYVNAIIEGYYERMQRAQKYAGLER